VSPYTFIISYQGFLSILSVSCHPSLRPTLLYRIMSQTALTFWHWSFTFNSNKSPTWCNSFSVYYLDVCLQLNMFRAFSRQSGPHWLQWQPLVLPSYHGDSRAVFMVGPMMFQSTLSNWRRPDCLSASLNYPGSILWSRGVHAWDKFCNWLHYFCICIICYCAPLLSLLI
jgi:hypothetical protein